MKVAAVGTGRPSSVATQGQVEGPRRLDAAGQSGGHEPGGGGDAHGYTPASGSPAPSGSPRARLAHCTAWPAAPLTRLSMADRTTTQPVRGSTRTVRWAVLEPLAALVDGGASVDDDERLVVVAVVQELHGVLRGQRCRGRRVGRNRWPGCPGPWGRGGG